MAMSCVVVAVVAIKISFFVSLSLCQDPTDIYHGCYFDGVDRALQDLITCSDDMGVCQESCGDEQTYCEGETGMTVDFCRTLCRNRNLQYYGLQAGSQCFCGGALADPFQYTEYTADQVNCSYPCSGDASQTCGGDFRMQVYEFNEPVPGADCFHPGFVPNSYVSVNLSPTVGEKVSYMCEPGHMLLGEPQLTCQTMRAWSPDSLPTCNYTGIFPDSLLYVGILIGVAVSVITAVLTLFIAKRIVHNGRNTVTQPPDPNRNSSIDVNPVFFTGNSENKGLSADGYYSTIADPSYEVNLRGLQHIVREEHGIEIEMGRVGNLRRQGTVELPRDSQVDQQGQAGEKDEGKTGESKLRHFIHSVPPVSHSNLWGSAWWRVLLES
ncbi:uncharacterized protein [Asterias amurensis]|uniref:uncharacterized protein n=1 Tax=Asterias amurensis TaxID=7602 RepID=UPI003AB3698F